MPIKASSGPQIRELIAALLAADDVRREAAIARLAVIGPRAVDALLHGYASAPDRDARIAVLRALEPMADRRTIAIAREALGQKGDVAVAATTAVRALLDAPDAAASTEALDLLVATALDTSAERLVRIAAFDALQVMPDSVRTRVREALESDPDQHLKNRARDSSSSVAVAEAMWQNALEGTLPEVPAIFREAAETRVAATPLSALQKMVDAVRAREGTVKAARRAEWQNVRGFLHQALALRGSRVAVYDLRESLQDAKAPLPPSFLTALHVVGDQSCLEPLAAAYMRSGADARWKSQLAAAFRAIARRERVSRRGAVVKRIATRWPEAARELTATSGGL